MTIEKKYELTDETIEIDGKTLYRIKALRDFGFIKTGELGGFIEKEDNLSHEGNCWVHDNSQVYGNARVFGNGLVYFGAKVFDNARIYDDARVYDNTQVHGHAQVYGNAHIGVSADISENAQIYGSVRIFGENTFIRGNAEICGDTIISDRVIENDALINSKNDWMYIDLGGVKSLQLTAYKQKNDKAFIDIDYFTGQPWETPEENVGVHVNKGYICREIYRDLIPIIIKYLND